MRINPTGFDVGMVAQDSAWRYVTYEIVGDPELIGLLETGEFHTSPGGGQCDPDDSIPIRVNRSAQSVRPAPARTGFTVMTLPDTPGIALQGLRFRSGLRFRIDNAALPQSADWVDVLVLDFNTSDPSHPRYGQTPTTTYRFRKVWSVKSKHAIEIWRQSQDAVVEDPLVEQLIHVDSLVARIPITVHSGETEIDLRWTQEVRGFVDGQHQVGSRLEIFVDASDLPIHSVDMAREWASMLSLGLIDYVASDDPENNPDPILHLSQQELYSERLY